MERMYYFKRLMKVKVCVFSFWAILIAAAFAMTGCVRVYAFKAAATAMPVYGVQDPEQPHRPSDCSGMIVSVTRDWISIQPSAGAGGDNYANATETPDKGVQALVVPLAEGALIRQVSGASDAEFVNLQPYEIVPGLYAEVWLDTEGNAAYIRVSVRMHLEALA